MTRVLITMVLVFLITPVARAEVGVGGRIFLGSGYRHSVTHSLGGLDLRIGLGVGVGPLGIQITSEHATDHSFKAADRTAGRGTNWLGLSVSLPLPGPASLSLGAGPGLGWIKTPGTPTEPNKTTVYGVHEFIRLNIYTDEVLYLTFQFEPQHQWQDAVLPGVDHSICVWMALGLAIGDS